ncbi:MAG: acetate/propionate family kinase [Actinobacteria bacterium]|nr:acetate/propionate family kinase [Actinomycetota bacterium]
MKIIVCNIGSSSFKFQLLEMETETQLARGYTERVGSDNAVISYWIGGEHVFSATENIPTHRESVQHALNFLVDKKYNILRGLYEIDGIGFKTIQAGERNGSVLLDDEVLEAMEYYKDLAPAHNPPYLTAIYMFKDLLPDTPLVGVFEPGFHINAPDYAQVYGTPYEWFEKFGVKKYGYHGASHRYVTWETVRILNLPKDNHKIITCHLGGSSSLCAFKNGVSIDTSMGFTPQTGLIQGTRIGDMDPYVLPYIMNRKGITLDEALVECSKKSGLAGLSGTSGDMRDINEAVAQGNKKALLARDKFIYDIKRYIGEFLIVLEGLDAVTFTGGIGQKDADLRMQVLSSMQFLGMKTDELKNDAHQTIISSEDSKIKALVLETNEEIVVARETVKVIQNKD